MDKDKIKRELLAIGISAYIKEIDYNKAMELLEIELCKHEKLVKKLTLNDVGSSLPDLSECNQASLDYADKENNPDFFLIKRTFKDGVNWALNYITKQK